MPMPGREKIFAPPEPAEGREALIESPRSSEIVYVAVLSPLSTLTLKPLTGAAKRIVNGFVSPKPNTPCVA